MEIRVRIASGSIEELTALREWLNNEDELRGRCRLVRAPIGSNELGSIPELLTVALSAGGAGTVLASSLITWLQTRKTTAKITVEADGRSVSLDIETVRDVGPVLQQILKVSDDQ